MRLRTTACAALACALSGCSGGADAPATDEGGTPASAGADRARLVVDRPLPALSPRTLAGAAADSLLANGWTALVLIPAGCTTAAELMPAWREQAASWARMGLGFVVVFERRPDEASLREEGFDVPVLMTDEHLFRLTGVLSEPVYTVVDPSGDVRFVGRRRGTLSEKLRSIHRAFEYQRTGDAQREAIARRAIPGAAEIRIERTMRTAWLGEDALRLGLSPWFARAFDGDGASLGFAFPIERETNCDTCDPVYLIVGVGPGGNIVGVDAIEPIFSGGAIELTDRLFDALRGCRSEKDIRKVARLVRTDKADIAIRQVVYVGLQLFERASGAHAGGT